MPDPNTKTDGYNAAQARASANAVPFDNDALTESQKEHLQATDEKWRGFSERYFSQPDRGLDARREFFDEIKKDARDELFDRSEASGHTILNALNAYHHDRLELNKLEGVPQDRNADAKAIHPLLKEVLEQAYSANSTGAEAAGAEPAGTRDTAVWRARYAGIEAFLRRSGLIDHPELAVIKQSIRDFRKENGLLSNRDIDYASTRKAAPVDRYAFDAKDLPSAKRLAAAVPSYAIRRGLFDPGLVTSRASAERLASAGGANLSGPPSYLSRPPSYVEVADQGGASAAARNLRAAIDSAAKRSSSRAGSEGFAFDATGLKPHGRDSFDSARSDDTHPGLREYLSASDASTKTKRRMQVKLAQRAERRSIVEHLDRSIDNLIAVKAHCEGYVQALASDGPAAELHSKRLISKADEVYGDRDSSANAMLMMMHAHHEAAPLASTSLNDSPQDASRLLKEQVAQAMRDRSETGVARQSQPWVRAAAVKTFLEEKGAYHNPEFKDVRAKINACQAECQKLTRDPSFKLSELVRHPAEVKRSYEENSVAMQKELNRVKAELTWGKRMRQRMGSGRAAAKILERAIQSEHASTASIYLAYHNCVKDVRFGKDVRRAVPRAVLAVAAPEALKDSVLRTRDRAKEATADLAQEIVDRHGGRNAALMESAAKIAAEGWNSEAGRAARQEEAIKAELDRSARHDLAVNRAPRRSVRGL